MDKKTIAIMAIAILVVVSLPLAVFATESSPSKSDGTPYDIERFVPEMASIFTDCNVIIISEVKGEETVKELAPNVRVQENFGSIEGIDVVLIDAYWAKTLDREYLYDSIDALLLESHPIMLIGGDSPWIFTDRKLQSVSMGFSSDKEDIFCLFYNLKTGASYGNSISGKDIRESLEVAFKWARELMDDYVANGFTRVALTTV